MARPGPVERIRERLRARAGPELAATLPASYQRLGRVLLVRWPESLRPEFPALAAEMREELGVVTVLRISGPTEGARRVPMTEALIGTETETQVREDGLVYRFDAAKILYSRGNRTERARVARLVSPGETVVDLFAGIGYFALPVARHGMAALVFAVEENPASFDYLVSNVRANHLEDRVTPMLGDNRSVDLPVGLADRALLGYLPDSRPWINRALGLLRPTGGAMHVHFLRGVRDDPAEAERSIRVGVEAAGGTVRECAVRVVKPYGPGREHVVADVRLTR